MKQIPSFNEVYKLPLHTDSYAISMVWTADLNSAFDFVTGTKDDIEYNDLISLKTVNQYLDVINGKQKSEFTQTFVYEDSYIYYKDDNGDLCPVISIRGWGHLISPGGLNLSTEDAIKIQDDFGNYIVEKLNKTSK